MAYYRRRYARKRTYRRRRRTTKPWYAKKYSVAQMATSAIRGVNYIRGLVNSELFKYDKQVNEFDTSNIPDQWSLTDIPKGDNEGERTGNSILLKRIAVRGYVRRNDAATTLSNRVRIILVYIPQCNTLLPWGLPTYDMIYDTTSYTSKNRIDAFLNNNTVGKYTILYNKVKYLTNDRPVSSININKVINKHTRWSNNVADNSGYISGHVGLYVLADSEVNPPIINWSSRTYYHDN